MKETKKFRIQRKVGLFEAIKNDGCVTNAKWLRCRVRFMCSSGLLTFSGFSNWWTQEKNGMFLWTLTRCLGSRHRFSWNRKRRLWAHDKHLVFLGFDIVCFEWMHWYQFGFVWFRLVSLLLLGFVCFFLVLLVSFVSFAPLQMFFSRHGSNQEQQGLH